MIFFFDRRYFKNCTSKFEKNVSEEVFTVTNEKMCFQNKKYNIFFLNSIIGFTFVFLDYY